MAKIIYPELSSTKWDELTEKEQQFLLDYKYAHLKEGKLFGKSKSEDISNDELLEGYLYYSAGKTDRYNYGERADLINDAITKLNSKDDYINRPQDFYKQMASYQQDLKDNLMLDPNGVQAQQYKQDMYNAINQYESDLEASLAASEMSAYAQLGQQQLELENTIAEQRMKALKSGTTSAQLASQQLANMFSAQSGAAQVANNMMSNRLQNYNTIAQARYGVTQDLYNTINANRQTYTTAQPQLAAVYGSYAANYDSPYAQFNAYKDLPKNIREELKN